MKEFVFNQLRRGQTSTVEVKLTKEMVENYSNLTEDHSAIHAESEFAKEMGFKDRVIHGMLLGGIVSRLVGMELPGRYGILHSVTLNFRKPCYIGDEILVEGEIVEIVESVKTIVVKIKITRKDRALVANGKAQIGVWR